MELTGGTKDVEGLIRSAVTEGVGKALHHILDVSNENVPMDMGDLKRSGKVKQDGFGGTITYDEEYAVAQHERLDFHHPKGGSAKYLESAMNTEASKVAEIVAREVRGRL